MALAEWNYKDELTQSIGKEERVLVFRRHRHRLPGKAEGLQDVLIAGRPVPAARRRQRALRLALVQPERRRRF